MGPKLLPSSRKDNKSNQYNDNPVSFSVYESGQLQIVANARDYGTCQGKVRVKQPDGMWSSNGHCKQWVDKRVSEYCQQHRRQQLKASVVAVNGKIKPMNTFQQLKVQTVRTPQAMAHLTMRTASTSQAPASNNRLILSQKASNDMSFLSSATPRNSLQPEATSDLARHVPMHMKKQINPPLVEQRTNAKVSVMHRLKNKRMTAAPTSTASSNDASSGNQGKRPLSTLAGDWLQEAVTDAKKAKPATRMASKSLSSYMKNGFKNGGSGKRVNVAGLGLDGSVVVPQPSRIFQGREATAFTTHTSASSGPSLVEKQEQLLQRQREFAQRRKEALASRNSTQEKAPSSNHMFRKQPGHDKTSASDALQEMFGDIDHEKVRNAKSRFSTEIEAEEYAASRQKIVELEKLEERKNKADANKNKNDEKRLIKEWRCKTCARNFSFKPKSCYKAGHEIVTVRNIRKDGTKEEMRTKMHSKKVEDGGLQLGAGLEWSDRFGGKNRFVA
jgi:minichromosome maintenance protein 10